MSLILNRIFFSIIFWMMSNRLMSDFYIRIRMHLKVIAVICKPFGSNTLRSVTIRLYPGPFFVLHDWYFEVVNEISLLRKSSNKWHLKKPSTHNSYINEYTCSCWNFASTIIIIQSHFMGVSCKKSKDYFLQ